MGLSNKLSCEAGSFSCCLNTHRFFQSEALRLYFPTLEPRVVWSVLLPSCSSWFIHTQMWDHPVRQPPPCLTSPPAVMLLPSRLPFSNPPTSLHECFFFNSLFLRLPYSSIFWQFWLFFYLKFVILLLITQGGKMYLPTPPTWLEVLHPRTFDMSYCHSHLSLSLYFFFFYCCSNTVVSICSPPAPPIPATPTSHPQS